MSQPTLPEPRNVPLGTTPHLMREPCRACGTSDGYLRTVGLQDVVKCNRCDQFCYNAPKTETGRAVRTLATTHAAIKPKTRAKVIIRAGRRCELCSRPAAATEAGLVVDHMLSVEDGHALGLTDAQINNLENLAALCTECNAGKGKTTLPLMLFAAIIRARTIQADAQANTEGSE